MKLFAILILGLSAPSFAQTTGSKKVSSYEDHVEYLNTEGQGANGGSAVELDTYLIIKTFILPNLSDLQKQALVELTIKSGVDGDVKYTTEPGSTRVEIGEEYWKSLSSDSKVQLTQYIVDLTLENREKTLREKGNQ